jgi:D-amino-acid dehydrogenase
MLRPLATWDLIVVGGGIVGASTSFHAARAGARVLVVDRDDAGRATSAGAGIVSPETDLHHTEAYFELGRRAAEYYPTLLDALPRRAGYQRCGMLVVAADEREERAFEAFAPRALQRQRERAEVQPAETMREIDGVEARSLFPPLASVRRALWNPRGARVDGREITGALHEGGAARGVQRAVGSVERILVEPSGGGGDERRVTGVIVDDERHDAPVIVVAGGAWSPALAAPLGLRVAVEPQRGQIAHLVLQGADSGPWPMVSGFRDHYLVAWPGGRVAVGATRETGSGFDARTTAAGVREVLNEALRLAPGLATATLLEVRVGLRPLAADGLPILGRAPRHAGLWLATGHGPAGLTLGPISGKLVAEAALGGEWPAWLEAFSLDRFARAGEGR